MSKFANPGELRTPVSFVRVERGTDADAISTESPIDIFGGPVKVKWVNAHGTEALTAAQMNLREPATITCRYSNLIKVDCLIYRIGDPTPYEIISIDNVEERGRWMEIKVKRQVSAR